jgi:uncharacterized membrane protein YraQ (UPF0718 family)
LPAAVLLKKQGANNGAVSAFLITTPESGIDSISITYALLDPIMTVLRPAAAFVSGIFAGFLENSVGKTESPSPLSFLPSAPLKGTSPAQLGGMKKIFQGLKYGFVDVWGDIVVWFVIGTVAAGIITVVIPDSFLETYLAGGILSMVLMLVAGVPLYICATASTPIAAALILKGVSPGAALVFLLVGPATNIASVTVLFGVLGKKSTLRYLSVVAGVAVLFGLMTDTIYALLQIEPQAVIGKAAEIFPYSVKLAGVVVLAIFSIVPVYESIRQIISKLRGSAPAKGVHNHGCDNDCCG